MERLIGKESATKVLNRPDRSPARDTLTPTHPHPHAKKHPGHSSRDGTRTTAPYLLKPRESRWADVFTTQIHRPARETRDLTLPAEPRTAVPPKALKDTCFQPARAAGPLLLFGTAASAQTQPLQSSQGSASLCRTPAQPWAARREAGARQPGGGRCLRRGVRLTRPAPTSPRPSASPPPPSPGASAPPAAAPAPEVSAAPAAAS